MANNIRNKTITNFAWKFSEQILSLAVNLVVSIVLARLLLPEDYGVVTVVLIFITLCDVFISQGFASSLIQKKDVDNLDYSSMFYGSLVLSLILYLILFFSAPFIQDFFGSQYVLLCPVLRVMGLQIPISSYKAIQQAIVSRNLLFRNFFWATLGGKIVSGGIGIYMAIKGFGAWALAGQSLSCVIVDTFILSMIVSWHPIWYFSWSRVKPMLSFGSKIVAAGLVDALYGKLRSFVIGRKFSPSELAYYDKGDQFPSILMHTANTSFKTVLFPVMSKFQDDSSQLLSICRRSVKISTYVIFPLMAGLAVISEDLITYLLSDKWLPSVPFAQIFCAVYMFYPIYSVNLQAIKAVGRGGAYLNVEIAKKVVGIICLLVAIPYGIYWIAFSLLVSTFLNYVINGIAAKRVIHYGYVIQFKDILPNALLTLALVAFLCYLPKVFEYKLLNLIYISLLGGIFYISISAIFRNENYLYLKESVQKRKKI